MHFLTFETLAIVASNLLEAALVLVLFQRRLARLYPVFVIYLFVNMVEDPVALLLSSSGPPYARFYFAITILDYLLQLLILFEITKSIFLPASKALPFRTWPVALVGVLLCGAVAATLSPQLHVARFHSLSQTFFRVSLGLALLKLLTFAFMALFAQFLGIGWKSHVLQLATGLAFYGTVSVIVQIAVNHLTVAVTNQTVFLAQYAALSHAQSLAYLATLGFWIWAFSRNEAPRKDFTPQMQEVLVTIAQTARRTRLAVTRSGEQP